MRNDLGEHVDSVKNWTDDDGNLLEDGVRGKKEGVLLGPVLDELLFFVELLEVFKVNNIDVDLVLEDLVLVLFVGDDADLKVGAGVVGKSDSSDETLVLLGIVVLEANLEFDGLGELALLHLLSKFGDCLGNLRVVDLCGHLLLKYLIINKRNKRLNRDYQLVGIYKTRTFFFSIFVKFQSHDYLLIVYIYKK